jgi:hypothetical protein
VAARLRVLLPIVAVAAALAAPAANADLIGGVTQVLLPTCGTSLHPFAQFGDSHAYYSIQNNGFENGSNGWTLGGGAYVGLGNEPWYVNGWGSHSLVLPPGASATSPGFCINLLDPDLRMFARRAANSGLQVQVLFRGLTGNLTGILNYATFSPSDYATWQPTDTVNSLLALPLGTSYAQVRLTSLASSGTWQVDDVFVDPWENCIG